MMGTAKQKLLPDCGEQRLIVLSPMMLKRLKKILPTSTLELGLMPVSFSRKNWSRKGVWFGDKANT